MNTVVGFIIFQIEWVWKYIWVHAVVFFYYASFFSIPDQMDQPVGATLAIIVLTLDIYIVSIESDLLQLS